MKNARIYEVMMSVAGHLADASHEIEMLARELPLDEPAADKLELSIDDLELSIRTSNCLRANGIRTLRDLASNTEAQIKSIRHLGARSMRELREVMSNAELEWRTP